MKMKVQRAFLASMLGVCLLSASVARAMSPATFPFPETTDPQAWSLSIRGLTGVIGGQAFERVYDGSRKLSELQWDISGVGLGGISLALQPGERWMTYASFVTALSKGGGEMKDYDWMVDGLGWTDYSRSEVDVDTAWIGDAGVCRELTRGPHLTMRAVVGFTSQRWEWSDRGQEYIYSEYDFRDTRGSLEGMPMVQYKQRYYIPYLGAQVQGGAGPWAWSAYVLFGPYIWAEDRDYHIARDVHFDGSFSGGNWLGAGGSLEWRMNPSFALAAGLQMQSIAEFKGDMKIVEADENYQDGASVAFDSVALTLSLRWTL